MRLLIWSVEGLLRVTSLVYATFVLCANDHPHKGVRKFWLVYEARKWAKSQITYTTRSAYISRLRGSCVEHAIAHQSTPSTVLIPIGMASGATPPPAAAGHRVHHPLLRVCIRSGRSTWSAGLRDPSSAPRVSPLVQPRAVSLGIHNPMRVSATMASSATSRSPRRVCVATGVTAPRSAGSLPGTSRASDMLRRTRCEDRTWHEYMFSAPISLIV